MGSDGNFTNGVAISLGQQFAVAQKFNFNEDALASFQQQLSFKDKVNSNQVGVSLSQRIFTPEDFENTEVQAAERPYAGYLELQSFYGQFSESVSQKNWLAIGYIGQGSGGQYLHEMVHDLIGSPEPKGWRYQIEEQITLQLAYQADFLLKREQYSADLDWELSSYSYSQLGNFRSETNIGLMLRGSKELSKSFGFLSPHYGHSADWSILEEQQGLYYASVHFGYRLNDLTIDGDLPYRSGISVQHLQTKASLGVIYPYKGFALGFDANLYSKAFKEDNNYWHGYASMTIQGNL